MILMSIFFLLHLFLAKEAKNIVLMLLDKSCLCICMYQIEHSHFPLFGGSFEASIFQSS